jgi:hypothetical protein
VFSPTLSEGDVDNIPAAKSVQHLVTRSEADAMSVVLSSFAFITDVATSRAAVDAASQSELVVP